MSEPTDRRPEPEIIPPGQPDPREARSNPGVWTWSSDRHGARVQFHQPGPLGLIAIFLVLAALSALGLLIFLGLAAIMLPLIGVLVLAGIVAGVLRRL